MKTKNELESLINRVLLDEIDEDELLRHAFRLLDVKEGDVYPEILWRAVHYLTDKDIRETDLDYQEAKQEEIRALLSSLA